MTPDWATTKAEKFLMLCPAINAFTAKLMLSAAPLMSLLDLPLLELCRLLDSVPWTCLGEWHKLVHAAPVEKVRLMLLHVDQLQAEAETAQKIALRDRYAQHGRQPQWLVSAARLVIQAEQEAEQAGDHVAEQEAGAGVLGLAPEAAGRHGAAAEARGRHMEGILRACGKPQMWGFLCVGGDGHELYLQELGRQRQRHADYHQQQQREAAHGCGAPVDRPGYGARGAARKRRRRGRFV